MASAGSAVLNFGAGTGTDLASVVVTGLTGILSNSHVEAWLMYEASTDNTEDEHLMVPLNLRCGTVVVGVGFTIYATSPWLLNGTYKVRWVWS